MLFYIIGYTVLSLKVAVGLGFVIFVHELGHFLVAKLCGVKCEKFYLGFDFWGLKFCKFRYGETEYGIGIFPLGGYVKMLGQEDNPGRLKEEIERAKEKDSGQNTEANGQKSEAGPLYDPRSFLAMSVPKRMAIISAGVIMNVVFAFLMAVVAVSPWMGVPTPPCIVGETLSGDPAWQAGLRPDDEILEIAGKPMRQFRDLQRAISLGDIDPEKGVKLLVRRPGVEEPFSVMVMPNRSKGAFLIGLRPGYTTSLLRDRQSWIARECYATTPGSPANEAKPPFECGDTIVQLDDTPINSYGPIEARLARTPDKTIKVTVERAIKNAKGAPTGKTERITIPVAPNPMRDLGMAMKMGPVTAVQQGSPAAAAGIQPGDEITQLDGAPVGDPIRLPDRLDRRAGERVVLTIRRPSTKDHFENKSITVRLRQPVDLSLPLGVTGSFGVSSLGVAYSIVTTVDGVTSGGPAAKAGIQSGDRIVKATVKPPKDATLRYSDFGQGIAMLPMDPDNDTWWPALMSLLQQCLPGTTVELTYTRDHWKEPKTATLTPIDSANWFNPNRGFVFEPMTFDLKARSFGDAFALGGRETLDSVTMVYRTVQKLSTNQVSMRLISGPVTIVQVALHYADQGTAELLLFLTLLSANLAVINFLPIPMLDGGHFVLLCYEGIRGKPAPESVQVVLSYIGLALVLALMIWAVGLDLGAFSRR